MRTQVCDLEYGSNNGTIAIRPSRNGRLSKLVKTMKLAKDDYTCEEERVWVFRDPYVYSDKNGNERINHITRGVVCGTYKQGELFMEMAKNLGLDVQYRGLFVPFSNGQPRLGHFSEDKKPFADYSENELAHMRWDLPTKEELTALL